MRTANTGGISYLAPLGGAPDWTWGTDHTSGDLYEAEELFRDGHRIRRNRLIFVRVSDGLVLEPVSARDGQYFGVPAWDGGRFVILLADFPAGEVRLLGCTPEGEASPIAALPLGELEDCYNLMPHASPLMLTRQTAERFQILWPEQADFPIHPAESFCLREGEKLYFSRWYEDPDYREEVVVRRYPDGEIEAQFRGALCDMPDGETWLLTDGGRKAP
ncbi:MAG: hypothetical protein IKP17_03730 [Oscillospiraceae bacterium]|nr:hypothetical protein [Oscillospiraceae bacterium]